MENKHIVVVSPSIRHKDSSLAKKVNSSTLEVKYVHDGIKRTKTGIIRPSKRDKTRIGI